MFSSWTDLNWPWAHLMHLFHKTGQVVLKLLQIMWKAQKTLILPNFWHQPTGSNTYHSILALHILNCQLFYCLLNSVHRSIGLSHQRWKKRGTRGTLSLLIFSTCAIFFDFHTIFCTILLCFWAFLQFFAHFCKFLHLVC